jgi:hypothetical protein
MDANIHSDRRRQAFALPHTLQSLQFVENPEQSISKKRFVALKSADEALSALWTDCRWESGIKHLTLKHQIEAA